ncbi:MAG: 30S ribosomal protein S20 [Acidobacteria bacterium]|nr:30S ribosomal protein S20 [Acidobacteriota bacterium]
MANTASAEKQARQNLRRRERNRANRSKLRTRVKGFLKTLEGSPSPDQVRGALARTLSRIDKAVRKRILHPNTAARKKSRFTRAANRAAGTAR